MRYCPRCAQANDDQAVYCTHCGFILQTQTSPSVQTQTPPPAAPYSAPYISPVYYTVPTVYTVPVAVTPVNQPALDRLRKLAGSPLVLLSAFLRTAALLVPFLLFVFNVMSLAVNSPFQAEMPVSFSYSFSMDITGILLCIALWTLYGSAHRRSGRVSAAPAGLIKASGIMGIISICSIAVVLLLALQTVSFITIAGDFSNIFNEATVIGMLVVGAVLAIGLLAGISAIVFANDLSAGLKTGIARGKGAIPLAIYLFLSAMAVLGTVAFVVAYTSFWPALLLLITAADNIVAGIAVLQYRSLIRELNE